MNRNDHWTKQPDTETITLRLLSNSLEKTFFLIKPAGREAEISLCICEVLWIEADNNYSHFHLIGRPSVKVQAKIGRIEEFLSTLSPGEFIRINRSEIINLRWLDKIEVNLVHLIGRAASFTVGKTYQEDFNRLTEAFRLTKM